LRNRCWHVKTISIRYCECVFVALGIQNAVRMRRIIISSVSCPALPYFSHLINDTIFAEKKIELTMFVLIFSVNFGVKHF